MSSVGSGSDDSRLKGGRPACGAAGRPIAIPAPSVSTPLRAPQGGRPPRAGAPWVCAALGALQENLRPPAHVPLRHHPAAFLEALVVGRGIIMNSAFSTTRIRASPTPLRRPVEEVVDRPSTPGPLEPATAGPRSSSTPFRRGRVRRGRSKSSWESRLAGRLAGRSRASGRRGGKAGLAGASRPSARRARCRRAGRSPPGGVGIARAPHRCRQGGSTRPDSYP